MMWPQVLGLYHDTALCARPTSNVHSGAGRLRQTAGKPSSNRGTSAGTCPKAALWFDFEVGLVLPRPPAGVSCL